MTDHDPEELVAAIHTLRLIKCRMRENHTEGGECPSCGL